MKNNERNMLLIIVIAVLVYLSYSIIKDFILVLLTGLILTYLFYPLFSLVHKKINSRRIASFVSILIVLLLFTIPTAILVTKLVKETNNAYSNIINMVDESSLQNCNNRICMSYNKLYNITAQYNLHERIAVFITNIGTKLSSSSINYVLNLPSFIINLIVILFIMYYFFIDGKLILEEFKKILPLKEKSKQLMFEKIKNITSGVFYGQMITAIIQGILGTIGFYILGIPNALLLGLLMTLVALVPLVGTFLVWGPTAFILLTLGIIQDKNILIIKAIILFVYGLLIISTVDNIIKPKIIGKKTNVHPLVILLGILGGVSFFGLIGIILGPLIISMTITLIKMYNEGILT
ncbi:AI-2E family transporter [Candidatus Woesearchaeota archaeon]|nr:AI-2E family transporter [Candidatus Woesearchaeota archaeon]